MAPLYLTCAGSNFLYYTKNLLLTLFLTVGLASFHESFSQCNNVTWGGQIGYDQTICSGGDPQEIWNINEPSGGSGALEVMWLYSNASSGWSLVAIPGATNLYSYNPPTITQTTKYRRCTRRAGCSSWDGESNDVTVTVTTCATCNNFTSGGTIGSNQTGCAGFDPAPFTSIASPSGGSGLSEIIWMYKNATSSWNWVVISGANSLTYDSGPVYENTTFRRCSRRGGCTSYNGESNDIDITIDTGCCNGAITNLAFYNIGSSSQYAVIQNNQTYLAGTLPAQWNIEANVTGTSAESVKFILSGPTSNTHVENNPPYRLAGDTNPLVLAPGSYTLTAQLYNQDNAAGTMCDDLVINFTIADCLNITNPGSICCDQSGCSPFDPGVITSAADPSGGMGNLEIVWIYKNASTGWNFQTIAGATGLTYDPPAITETTIVRRCSRRQFCSDFVGESNDITLTVTACCNVTNGGQIGADQTGCSGYNPNPFISVSDPSGGLGTLQYMWLFKSQSTGWVFQTIAGANSSTYDAGPLTETTVFRRCSKRTSCSSWDGESNDLTITITPVCPCVNITQTCSINDAGAGHALWTNPSLSYLLGVSNNNFIQVTPGTMTTYSDGTMKIEGSVKNAGNATKRFNYVANYRLKRNYTQWTAIPNANTPSGFREPKLDAGTTVTITNEFLGWDYYELDPNKPNQLVGTNALAGIVLTISHRPSDYRYGAQLGDKGSLQSNGLGFSAWIDLSGTINGNVVNDHGDFNMNLTGCNPGVAFDASVNVTQPTCANICGGTATASAVGGIGNYTYLWSNGATTATASNLCAGNYTVTVSSGTCTETLDVAINTLTCLASLGDYVWYDNNQNGIQDAGETGVQGVTVSLYNCNNTFISSTTTNNVGFYQFLNLTPNQSYYVVFGNLPSGYIFTIANNGADNLDSDAGLNGQTTCVSLVAGQNYPDLDAGITNCQYPVLQGQQPADFTLICTDVIPAEPNLVFIDPIFGNIVPVYTQVFQVDNCAGRYIRTWVATNSCGNSTTVDQLVEIIDNIAPVLNGVPANETLECGTPVSDASVSATDNCDNDLIVAMSGVTNYLDCGYDFVRTWSVTDNCGNTTSQTQVIHFEDTTAPVLISATPNSTIECDETLPEVIVTFEDSCDDELSITIDEEVVNNNCGYTYTKTCTAVDDCGNTTVSSTTITVVDTTAPSSSNEPANLTLNCDQTIPFTAPLFIDNCDQDLTVAFEESAQEGYGCGYRFTRTWTAYDNCDNSKVVSQIITVLDQTPPVLNNVPSNASAECDEIPAAANVTVTDNCDLNIIVQFNESVQNNNGCSYTLVRTWTATDDCGNTTTATQNIQVSDATAPVLNGSNNNTTVECSAIPAAPQMTATDNCDDDIQIEFSEVMIPGDQCTYTLQRTWTATDNCGNESAVAHTLIVTDTTPPIFTVNPENATVSCDDVPAAAVVIADDNCDDNVNVELSEVITDGCPYTITRTWIATDNCNNQSATTQVLTVVDNVAPVLYGVPGNMTVECTEPMSNTNVYAEDNCDDNVIVALQATTVNNDCGSVFTRTWSAQDACGNQVSATQVITIVDTTAPVIAAPIPAEITIECSDVRPDMAPAFEDACDNDLVIVYNEEEININECGLDIVKTWSATDNCDNTTSVQQIIHIRDTTAPVLIGVPSNATAQCQAIPATASVTATDNCSDAIVEFSEQRTAGCPYTITRTWTATDNCGNVSNASQVIEINDVIAPTLINVPASATAECSAIPAAANVTASDNCDQTLAVEFSEETSQGDGCTYQITRSWSVTDDCNNTSAASQVLTIVDTTNPTLVGVPANATVECDAIPQPAIVSGDDNCDDYVEVAFNQTQTNGCPYTITRTWTAIDNCGNDVSASQTITVIDTHAPVFNSTPENTTVSCDDVPAPAQLIAQDNCDDNVEISFSENATNGCPYTITRTWTAVDNCDNTTTIAQVITVEDNVAPVFNGVPQNITVECGQAIPGHNVSATDNCSTNLQVQFSEETVPGDCGYSIVRNWSVTDLCGNTTSAQQVVTVVDTTNPVLVGVPANTTVSCGQIPAAPTVTATDNCDSNLEVNYYESLTSGCPYTISRTWSVTDACGNNTTMVQVITVIDIVSPVLNGVPANAQVLCNNIPAAPVVTATDNCSSPAVTFTEEISSGCPYTITRTWSATDNCANITTATQVINVIDNVAPVLVGVPVSATVQCSAIPAAANVTATDNCDQLLEVIFSQQATDGDGCTYQIIRTWTVTDNCNNTTTASQTLNIIDTNHPLLVGVPANVTVQCNAIPQPASVAGTDNCDTNVEVTFSQTQTDGCPYTIVRTWVATDNCGNNTTGTQTITVVDTTAPVLLNVPANGTANCNDVPMPVVVTAIDNCDNDVEISYSENQTTGCPYTITRTWIAKDNCNNQSTAIQVINVVDTEAPQLIGVPDNITIECTEAITNTSVFAIDNCDDNVMIALQANTVQLECGYTFLRTWTAIDACGNQTSATQVVTVLDTAPPAVSVPVPATINLECNETIPATTPQFTDGCDNTLDVVYTSEEINSNACGYDIVRIWTATDNCDNQTTVQQVIYIRDTTAPVLNGVPANTTAQCDAIPAIANVTATDNCSENLEVTYDESETAINNCSYQITRYWTVSDSCGNTATASQVITVSDATGPIVVSHPTASITVECNAVPAPVAPVFIDNCDEELNVNYISGISNETNCGYDIERSWVATDNCGNDISFTQIVHVVDTTHPTLAGVPANATVECTNVPNPAVVSATDNCDDQVTVLYSEQVQNLNCGYIITRTWTAADICGNQTAASQVITVTDTTDPTVVSAPQNATYSCDENIPNIAPVFTDNCDQELNVEFTSSIEMDGCNKIIHRNWTATDNCGNSTAVVQNITVVDTTAPDLVGVPSNLTVQCTDLSAAPVVTAIDNCDEDITVMFVESVGQGCPYTITRTWTAADDCGNEVSAQQIITVIDTQLPVIIAPADITVECNSIPAPANVTATDNCDTSVEVTFAQQIIPGNDCTYTILRTWTATDNCGNQNMDSQTLTIVDNTNPVLVGLPGEATVECTNVPAPANVTATDNCDTDVYVSFTETQTTGCPYVITRTWVATDNCGHTATGTQIINVVDETSPVLFNVPGDLTIECTGVVPAPATDVYGTDNCDNQVDIQVTDLIVPQECGMLLKRTYAAVDNCGNTTTQLQLVYIIDETAPILVNVPTDITIECDDTLPAPSASITATDNCDDNVTISHYDLVVLQECGYLVKRFYTATDDCGNETQAAQIITVIDETAPVFTTVPSDITVNCENIPAPAELAAQDNCDAELNITFGESVISSGCPYQIKRTWTATDDCGNSTVMIQVLTIVDETAPVFDPFPVFTEVECDQVGEYTVTAHDNCDGDVTITIIEELTFSGGCYGTIQRIYEAEDVCGNTSQAIQLIDIIDTSAPVLHNIPAEVTVACNGIIPPAPANVYATDNCTEDLTITFTQTQTGPFCPYDIIRQWSTVDPCGNVTVATQVIHVTVRVPQRVQVNAFPNPSTAGELRVQFSVPEDEQVMGGIYDVTGRLVVSLIDGQADGGTLYDWHIGSENLRPGTYSVAFHFGEDLINKQILIVE
jgi:large repetitive protein